MSAVITIHTDGGSRGNPGPAACGIVVHKGTEVLYEAAEYLGTLTNNEAEYTGVLRALEWLTRSSLSEEVSVEFYLDSKLVVEQLNKNWKIKDARMKQYADRCFSLIAELPITVSFTHVPRNENADADALVNQALDAAE